MKQVKDWCTIQSLTSYIENESEKQLHKCLDHYQIEEHIILFLKYERLSEVCSIFIRQFLKQRCLVFGMKSY